jgi:mRNA-degrading endonuclease RelE of RelBE toxin-antitoxin system
VAVQVELGSQARRDLKRVDPGRDRKAVIDALTVGLTAVPPPGNLDLKALKGAAPWLRLRVGDYRILYRPLTQAELEDLELSKGLGKLLKQGTPPEELGKELGKLIHGRSRRRRRRAEAGYLVARIVHRRDLDRAVRTLPLTRE